MIVSLNSFMAEIKTKPTVVSVDDYIDKQAKESVRDDCRELVKIMKRVTGEKPKMWGPSIVGFGQYHYKYESGHEGDMCVVGFAARAGKLTVYVASADENFPELTKKLGKYKASKGCLYINKLSDVDTKVLEQIVAASVKFVEDNVAEKTTKSHQSKK